MGEIIKISLYLDTFGIYILMPFQSSYSSDSKGEQCKGSPSIKWASKLTWTLEDDAPAAQAELLDHNNINPKRHFYLLQSIFLNILKSRLADWPTGQRHTNDNLFSLSQLDYIRIIIVLVLPCLVCSVVIIGSNLVIYIWSSVIRGREN